MRDLRLFFMFFSIVFFSACATKKYDWVKLSSDKIRIQKETAGSGKIQRVDLVIDLKEKSERFEYADNFNDYPKAIAETSKVNRVSKKTSRSYKASKTSITTAKNTKATERSSYTPLKESKRENGIKNEKAAKVLETKNTSQEEIALEKLNNSLKLPKEPVANKLKQVVKSRSSSSSKSLIQRQENIPASPEPKPPVQQTQASAEPKQPVQQTQAQAPVENLNEGNKESIAEDETVQQELDTDDNSQNVKVSDQDNSKKNSYIWVGLVLLIVGLIIGLIFGGMAYLISLVGVVFMAIGYLTRL